MHQNSEMYSKGDDPFGNLKFEDYDGGFWKKLNTS